MDNEAIVRAWFDAVWNQADGERNVGALRSTDSVSLGLANDTIGGVDRFAAWVRTVKRVVPDVRVTVEQAISNGPTIAVRARLRGHVGSRAIDIEGMGMLEIRDGRIAHARNQWDVAKLLAQLGMPVAHTTLDDVFTALSDTEESEEALLATRPLRR